MNSPAFKKKPRWTGEDIRRITSGNDPLVAAEGPHFLNVDYRPRSREELASSLNKAYLEIKKEAKKDS